MTRQEAFPRTMPPPREGRRAVEVAGGATAECAAVCCCVPCAVVEVVVLAAYKVPKGLVMRAVESGKRRRLQEKARKAKRSDALLPTHQPGRTGCAVADAASKAGPTLEDHLAKDSHGNSDSVELEREMWDQFNGAGFWRSSSHRFQQHEKTQ